MSKPRVAILHYSCPPVIGGVEFIIEAHAVEFARAGYPVRLVVGAGGKVHRHVRTVTVPEIGSQGGPLADTLKELGRGRVPERFASDVEQVASKLQRALRDVDVCMMHNVMTVHFNLVLTAALARLMSRPGRTRFMAWTHDMTFAEPVYEAHQRDRYPWTLMSAPVSGCRYCAISEQRRKQLGRLFKLPASRIPVIPDGIDVTRHLALTPPVQDLYRKEKLFGVDVVAMTPARILRRKNLGLGMEVAGALKAQGKSLRWLITGAPDPHNPEAMKYYRELLALRKNLGLQRDVIFLGQRFDGPVSNEDLRSLYSISDMLLFPSDREGFGLPALEAGLFSLLLVLRAIPALKEVGGRDAVYLRDGEKAEAVAGRVVRALEGRPTLRYRKQVISEYSWEAVFRHKILPLVLERRSTGNAR